MSGGAIKWGPIRVHDGSAECPPDALDVACMVRVNGVWFGRVDPWPGAKWTWKHVTAYRLPADVPAPAPAADPVRDAMVEALDFAKRLSARTGYGMNPSTDLQRMARHLVEKLETALALAKGEK